MGEIESYPGGAQIYFPDESITVIFDGLHWSGSGAQSGLWGQASIVSNGVLNPGTLDDMRINLSSGSSREQLIRSLRSADKNVDWDTVVKSACIKTLRLQRQGTPVVDLSRVPRPAKPVYTLEKLLQANQFSILYGEKESGKSLVALSIAVAVAEGNDLLMGLQTEPSPVYLLDWETDEETQAIRLSGLMAGLAMREPPAVHYRRMERPMVDDLSRIRKDVSELKIGLTIVDSIGFACGSELKEHAAATDFYRACRSLGCTVLAIGQTKKSDDMTKRRRFSVYGSTFFEYAARSIWRGKGQSEEEKNELRVGLYHEKANNSPHFRALGFFYRFANDAITVAPISPRDEPDLANELPLADRIAAFLSAGPREVFEIAEETGCSDHVARTTLARYKDRFTRTPKGWGLLSERNIAQQ